MILRCRAVFAGLRGNTRSGQQCCRNYADTGRGAPDAGGKAAKRREEEKPPADFTGRRQPSEARHAPPEARQRRDTLREGLPFNCGRQLTKRARATGHNAPVRGLAAK